MIHIEEYTSSKKKDWEELLKKSKNGTFLHSRNYMDYHSDRFKDGSLMVYDGDECVGIFPANIDGGYLYSHAGLTYGGFVFKQSAYTKEIFKYLAALLKFCNNEGYEKIKVKLSPDFYNTVTQQEIEYALELIGAKMYKADLSSAVELQSGILKLKSARKRASKRATKYNVLIKEDDNLKEFWDKVLIPNLMNKHGVEPVHTISEIEHLYKKNKNHIRHFNAYFEGNVIAGSTVFETETTAHAQYISATEKGQDLGALDLLFSELITNVFAEKKFFDFGKSNEDTMESVNLGLLYWKESFGARGYLHRFYEVHTSGYKKIEHLLV